MKEFRIVFGQKYARQAHPLSTRIHPNGWVVVMAEDADDARVQTYAAFRDKWSDVREASDDDLNFFPMGELGRLDNGTLSMKVELRETD